MPRRTFDDMNDGEPGDDDTRYAPGPSFRRTRTETIPTASSSNALAAPGGAGSTYDEEDTYVVTPEIAETMFREVHGRMLNTMQPLYQLPADEEEVKVRRPLRPLRAPLTVWSAFSSPCSVRNSSTR